MAHVIPFTPQMIISSFFKAAKKGDVEYLRACLEVGPRYGIVNFVNLQDHNGYTALMHAMKAMNVNTEEVVALLISAGADVNLHDRFGGTPLMEAAGKSNENVVQVVEQLLNAGANPHQLTNTGLTALMRAVQYNCNFGVVQALLRAGTDPNVHSTKGLTALMYALQYGHMRPELAQKVVQALLRADADPNVTSDFGITALMSAIANGYVEVVQALLRAGADPNVHIDYRLKCTPNGMSALMYAVQRKNLDIFKKLISAHSISNDTVEKCKKYITAIDPTGVNYQQYHTEIWNFSAPTTTALTIADQHFKGRRCSTVSYRSWCKIKSRNPRTAKTEEDRLFFF